MRKRYLGNKDENHKEVHDLNNEQRNCQISEIRETQEFSTLEEAKRAGYDPCAYCLPGSKR